MHQIIPCNGRKLCSLPVQRNLCLPQENGQRECSAPQKQLIVVLDSRAIMFVSTTQDSVTTCPHKIPLHVVPIKAQNSEFVFARRLQTSCLPPTPPMALNRPKAISRAKPCRRVTTQEQIGPAAYPCHWGQDASMYLSAALNRVVTHALPSKVIFQCQVWWHVVWQSDLKWQKERDAWMKTAMSFWQESIQPHDNHLTSRELNRNWGSLNGSSRLFNDRPQYSGLPRTPKTPQAPTVRTANADMAPSWSRVTGTHLQKRYSFIYQRQRWQHTTVHYFFPDLIPLLARSLSSCKCDTKICAKSWFCAASIQ